jgi:ribonuclease P protein component
MIRKGKTLALPRRMRLSHARQFDAIRKTGVRAHAGPLILLALPNELPFSRLGLAISRRAGGAVVRSRLKRMIRESFRLLQHELPTAVRPNSADEPPSGGPASGGPASGGPASGGYDLLVSARAHEPLSLEEYQQALRKAVSAAHQTWTSRLKQSRSRRSAKPPADQ